MWIIILWVAASLVGGLWWYAKGYRSIYGFLVSLILSPVIGLVITAILQDNKKGLHARRARVIARSRDFEYIYCRYQRPSAKYGEISPEIKILLSNLHKTLIAEEIDANELKTTLTAILDFLTTSEGRKSGNYWMVDLLISDYKDLWRPYINRLPHFYNSILNAFEFMHGAIDAPDAHIHAEEILKMVNELSDKSEREYQPRLLLKIDSEDKLKDVGGYRHDYTFDKNDIYFDPENKVFKLVCYRTTNNYRQAVQEPQERIKRSTLPNISIITFYHVKTMEYDPSEIDKTLISMELSYDKKKKSDLIEINCVVTTFKLYIDKLEGTLEDITDYPNFEINLPKIKFDNPKLSFY